MTTAADNTNDINPPDSAEELARAPADLLYAELRVPPSFNSDMNSPRAHLR